MGIRRFETGLRAVVIVAAVAASSGAGSAQASQPQYQYPDLKTEPPTHLHRVQTADSDEIRFSNNVVNAGVGALEIRDGELVGGSFEAVQRIYADSGKYLDEDAGDFTYHQDHGHWHFDDFALYELWREDLYDAWHASNRLQSLYQPLATTEKVSFCLIDTERVFSDAFRKNPFYSKCDDKRQGISAGWADLYGYWLEGQSVSVPTGFFDGPYVLRSVADPTNRLHESDNDNNDAICRFLVSGGAVNATC